MRAQTVEDAPGGLLLESVPGGTHRYKVSRGGRFLGWVERWGRWWHSDGPDRQTLPARYRLRRDALAALERLAHAGGG
jgi:hypothetical protein